LVLRFGWGVAHMNPLAHLKIPAVPTLEAETKSGGTNSVTSKPAPSKATNAVAAGKQDHTNSTSSASKDRTNAASETAVQKTNTTAAVAKSTALETNTVIGTNAVSGTNSIAATAEQTRTNAPKAGDKSSTNALAQSTPGNPASSNSPPSKVAANA